MNQETIELVLRSIERAHAYFDVPLLLENPPIYFRAPGSTMTQTEFVREICLRSSVGLLLDLAHFYITSQTMQFDPRVDLQNYPLDRVIEIHLSGVDVDGSGIWDDHSVRAPDIEFELLSMALAVAPVRAITLEYNWSSRFPAAVLLDEIARTRQVLSAV
jgi:uncharacterized protein (UPF0276 family)